MPGCSRTEQSGRDHGDPIWAALGFRARGDDNGVEHLVPEFGFEPVQVLDIAFSRNLGELTDQIYWTVSTSATGQFRATAVPIG